MGSQAVYSGPLAIQNNAFEQFWREALIPGSLQRYRVLFLDLITGVSDTLRQLPIVGQEEQALGLRVQPADAKEPAKFQWKQIKNSVASVNIFASADEASGLMQHNGNRRLDVDKSAIDLNVIAWSRLDGEVCANLPINRHSAGRDQLVASPPRADAGGGEVAIEAHAMSVYRSAQNRERFRSADETIQRFTLN